MVDKDHGLGMSRARHHRVDGFGWCGDQDSSPSEDIPVTFALSLHARPDDGLRDELIPVNSKWKSTRHWLPPLYFDKTGAACRSNKP